MTIDQWTGFGAVLVAVVGVVGIIVKAALSRKDRAVLRYGQLVDDLTEDVKGLREENKALRAELVAERAAAAKQSEQIKFLDTKLAALERQLTSIADGSPSDSPLRQLTRALWG